MDDQLIVFQNEVNKEKNHLTKPKGMGCQDFSSVP